MLSGKGEDEAMTETGTVLESAPTLETAPWAESAIEPELPICDPHHHLWDYPGSRYLLDELNEDLSGGHNMVSTVFVECNAMYRAAGPAEMRPVGEVEFVQGVAAQSASGNYGRTLVAAGIVGHADLSLGAKTAGEVLEALIAASPNRFRGIRHQSAWDADPNVGAAYGAPQEGRLLKDDFRDGFSRLSKLGLSFDAWLYQPQIGELADLARVFPETTIILNHLGGPLGIGEYGVNSEKTFDDWQAAIADVATCPNVVVKLGGLGMHINGFGWDQREIPIGAEELAEAMAPHYLWCIERFGTDRCMFESNFPVDKVSYSYTTLWNAFKRLSRDFSASERAALFHDTAARVYRIEV